MVGLGMKKQRDVLTISRATATCSLRALLLPRPDVYGAGLIVLSTLLMLAVVQVLESTGRKD